MKQHEESLGGRVMSQQVSDFFLSDVWDLKRCPIGAGPYFEKAIVERTLDFRGIHAPIMKQQVKDYIQYVMTEGYTAYKHYHSIVSEQFRRWFTGIQFLTTTTIEYTDIQHDFDALNAAFVEYVKATRCASISVGRTGRLYVNSNLLSVVRTYIATRSYNKQSLWENDIWYRGDLPLPPEQINLSSGPISINMTYIKNDTDRQNIKLFLRYLIEDRKISFGTTLTYAAAIRGFTTWLQKHGGTFTHATREDALAYYDDLKKKVSHTTIDMRISALHTAYEYLMIREHVANSPVLYTDRYNDPYHYRLAAVDDQTIIQIFQVLHLLDPKLVNMFLVIFSTGMRISEACQIKNDCLVHNEKGFFLIYYCQKMKKDVMSPISQALFERLEAAISANATLDWDEEYLFWRAPHKPYIASTFREQLQGELEKHNISCPDGQQFVFKPHDLRHTIATKLYKSGSTIAVIQKVLHHVSIEMSLAYVECDDDQMRQRHAQYLNYRGESVPIEHDTERIQWLRESIKSQALPNGICALPVSMGKCPHCNACLDGCPYFQTSIEYLAIHKSHLASIEEYIRHCQENGWNAQIEGATRVRDNLMAIIGRLQE